MQVTIHPTILQFKQPAGTSRGVYTERKVWYLEAEHLGAWGIGECAPLPKLSCDDVEDYEQRLADYCRQAESLVADHWDVKLEDFGTKLPGLCDYPSIRFGIETLWLSLKASRQHCDPFRLYDTPFARGEVGTIINGLVWMGTYDEMRERMARKLADGFRCIKIKIGAIDFDREVALLSALRQQYPASAVQLRVDANGAFSPAEASARLARLAEFDIHSIEQPIRAGQWQTMAFLCQTSPLPIALDEELIGINTREQKVALLDTIKPQYIILKPSLHGGITGCHEWIDLATARGIGYWVTSALETNVGLNAIAQWQSTLPASPWREMPQGLGTGQLFETNYPHLSLDIEGQTLYAMPEKGRTFRRDLEQCVAQWQDSTTTMRVQTSGSTGVPKQMAVLKSRMAASAQMTLDVLGLQPGMTALLCMPLQYIAGKMMVVRSLVGNLRLMTVTPSSRPLRAPWCNPDFLAVTPMQAFATLTEGDEDERNRFCSIPYVIIGGGAIGEELSSLLRQCRGAVFSTYGMTETLSHIALRPLTKAAHRIFPAPDGAYMPLPGVTLSADADNCLVIDAPHLSDQRLTTNDIVSFAPDGSFKILGRRDNVVCSGGIKLQVEDIEHRLAQYFSNPLSYAITAVPDERLGEALTLLVTEDVCPPFDQLGAYEQPRNILRVAAIPLTPNGKIDRPACRKLAQKHYS